MVLLVIIDQLEEVLGNSYLSTANAGTLGNARYFGIKRKYLLSALSLAVMFVLFRPEMWL